MPAKSTLPALWLWWSLSHPKGSLPKSSSNLNSTACIWSIGAKLNNSTSSLSATWCRRTIRLNSIAKGSSWSAFVFFTRRSTCWGISYREVATQWHRTLNPSRAASSTSKTWPRFCLQRFGITGWSTSSNSLLSRKYMSLRVTSSSQIKWSSTWTTFRRSSRGLSSSYWTS